uniref:RWD domain-containing protein 1 n=1 Tax=Romanomermis culicivorax TaxID=13658 RepID=A0A915K412_ROMCU
SLIWDFPLIHEELHRLREKYLRLREDEKEARKQKEEEVERKKLEGTAVTIENFMSWKLKFDEEIRQLRLKQGLISSTDKNNRPTGREQFLKDADLCTSDIRLIEETGEEIKIDESLFDDLDINDQDFMSGDEED